MKPEPRNVTRYRDFDPAGIKIHPLKRALGALAKLLPASWRFRLLGLPARATDAPDAGAAPIRAIPDGIASEFGAHLDARGRYVPALTSGAGRFIETRFILKQRCFPRVRRVRGTLLSLAHEAHVNYYRWLMETLPRLREARSPGVTFDAIYACQKHPFHRESLRLLGCNPARVIAANEYRFVQADAVLVPSFVDEAEPWVVPWLRDQFLPAAKQRNSTEMPRRIYITRRKATGRHVANEAELLATLQPLGFVCVVAEELDWLHQIALFHHAECIVAPHGAGLANLVFASPPVLVVELIAEAYPFSFFPEISRQLDLRHHMIFGAPVAPSQIRSTNLRVDPAAVLAVLEKELN